MNLRSFFQRNLFGPPRRNVIVAILLIVFLSVLSAFGLLTLNSWRVAAGNHKGQSEGKNSEKSANLELIKGEPGTVRVPADVVERFGIQTAPVQTDVQPQMLRLDGTLFVDPSRLARVHARFVGEVGELAPSKSVPYMSGNGDSKAEIKPTLIHFGDQVQAGQLLAVIWSKDLGEKKSELVDAILRLRLDDLVLERLRDLWRKGATPEQKLHDAERNREADLIAMMRAERTLRSWRLTEEEIAKIRAEADRVVVDGLKPDEAYKPDPKDAEIWSKVEVRSPISGVVVEVNINPGDIVDTTLDLFKIADMTRLRVLAHVYEEDLPELKKLQSQPAEARRWSIQVAADRDAKPLEGELSFDQIGYLIDPSQHTAQVMGWVENPDGRLLIGQFVTATVPLAPRGNCVTVNSKAVLGEGTSAQVFVRQPSKDKDEFRFRQKTVAVAHVGRDTVEVVRQPSEGQRKQGIEPLEPREEVVVDGALELAGALEDLQSSGG